MCKNLWAFWYGFTHAFEKIDLKDVAEYINSKCNKN